MVSQGKVASCTIWSPIGLLYIGHTQTSIKYNVKRPNCIQRNSQIQYKLLRTAILTNDSKLAFYTQLAA